MMGVTDYKEILKAKIFNYTHEHIRLRHLVLERLGLYQVPDKHGRTKIRNPSLCRIVDSTDKRFATACAGISLEEYNAFSESLKAEIAEKEEDELQSDEDEEEEEEEETDGFEGEKSRIEDNEGKDESR